MIIKTDVSEAHEAEIQSAVPCNGMGQTDWTLRRVLYYLAGREENYRNNGGSVEVAVADLLEDVFAGAVEAARKGELE